MEKDNINKRSRLMCDILGLILGATFVLGIGSNISHKTNQHWTQYQQVAIKADSDRTNGTTKAEWATVYNAVGKQFDEFSSSPIRDLSNTDLKTYLEM